MYRVDAELEIKETKELSLAIASELTIEDPEDDKDIINENKNTEGDD